MTTSVTGRTPRDVADDPPPCDVKLLIVDDDVRLATALRAALTRQGYTVTHARTAAEVSDGHGCDLVLLDLGLPDADGLDVCRRLRQRDDVGIIIVSGRTEQHDRITGLAAGADDYVVKPFGLLELTARLQAVLRRYRPRPCGPVAVGPLTLDPVRRQACVRGHPVRLTRKEFQVLAVLASAPGTVVARERLLREVWQTSWVGKSRTVDMHIATLRAKLGSAVVIDNVRGVGYRLAEPAENTVPTRETYTPGRRVKCRPTGILSPSPTPSP